MVEVDPTTKLIGADGPVSLIDIFDGRSQLIAYFQMWHTGRPWTVPWYGWDGQVLRTAVPVGAAGRPTSQDN